MDYRNGKTFWDLVHQNNVVKFTLIAIVLVIVFAIIFLVVNGYSVTTSGIIPPQNLTDSIKTTRITQTNNLPDRGFSVHQVNKLLQLIWVIFFLQIVLVLAAILIFSTQIILKRKSHYIQSFERRVEVFEFIYKAFIEFTLFDREQHNELLSRIQMLSRYVVDNGLYIDKRLMKLSNEVSDYFKEVLVDFRKKDLAKEQELQNKFKSLFN